MLLISRYFDIYRSGSIKRFTIPNQSGGTPIEKLGVIVNVNIDEGFYTVCYSNGEVEKVDMSCSAVSPRLNPVVRKYYQTVYNRYFKDKESKYNYNQPITIEEFCERLNEQYVYMFSKVLKGRGYKFEINLSTNKDENTIVLRATRGNKLVLFFGEAENPYLMLHSDKYKKWIQNEYGIKMNSLANLSIKAEPKVVIDLEDITGSRHTQAEDRIVRMKECYEYCIVLKNEQLTKRNLENIVNNMVFAPSK